MDSRLWDSVDFFDRTLREFDFTRRAMKEILSVVYSPEFEEMDSDTIFRYLFQEMEIVSFSDYLKRYLYERAGIRDPFRSVSDGVYRDILRESFLENSAPYSFEATSKKPGAIMKRWLTQDGAKRNTIFLLGFGLRMTEEDVSGFLTKVLQEEDFRNTDPREVIFRYCYRHSLRYARAKEWLTAYASAPSEMELLQSGQLPEELRERLGYLKKNGDQLQQQEKRAFDQFLILLDRARETAAGIYQRQEEENHTGRYWSPDDITPGDLEKIICSGIPMTGSGNLQRVSSSVLAKHFRQKRMSRQRIVSILSGESQVDRFDLITLFFFVCSQEMESLEPEVRCRLFISQINPILIGSGMTELYPVHAYEAFVLMCLISDSPLETYSDIWEMSYSSVQK